MVDGHNLEMAINNGPLIQAYEAKFALINEKSILKFLIAYAKEAFLQPILLILLFNFKFNSTLI